MIKVFHKGPPLGTSKLGGAGTMRADVRSKIPNFGALVSKVQMKSHQFLNVIAAWSLVSSPELRCDMKDLFPHVAKSIAALSDTAIAN